VSDRTRRLATDDPALYELQSAREEWETRQAARVVTAMGAPTVTHAKEVRAEEGALVVCDPTPGAFSVYLPSVPKGRMGAVVTVVNASCSRTAITIRVGDGSDTINGETSVILKRAYGVATFVKVTSTKWLATGDVPNPHGEYYISTAAATVIGAGETDTYEKMAGTTTAGDLRSFTMPSNNRLTYTGACTRLFKFQAVLSTGSSASNTLYHSAFAKNGTVIETKEIERAISSGAVDQGASALLAIIEMDKDDYVEVWVKSDKAASLTVNHGVVVADEEG